MFPSVTITKVSGGSAGAVSPSAAGINAVVAAASTGQQNIATSFSTIALMASTFSTGPLAELGAYNTAVSNKPIVLIRAKVTTAGASPGLTTTVTGSSVVS